MLNQSQWTLATISQDNAVKDTPRNKVILPPGNARMIFLSSILNILPPIENSTDTTGCSRHNEFKEIIRIKMGWKIQIWEFGPL